MSQVKSWGKGIVFFHIGLVVSMIVLHITGEEEDWILAHEIAGYFIVSLLVFRIGYHFYTKQPQEKLTTWLHHPKDLLHFFKNLFTHKEDKYHNPASSYMMIALCSLIVLLFLTGSFGLVGEEESGFLSYFATLSYSVGNFLIDQHELLSDILYVLIILHICGSILSSLITKTNLIKPIFWFKKK